MINPILSTRTRIGSPCLGVCTHCDPISIPLSPPAPVRVLCVIVSAAHRDLAAIWARFTMLGGWIVCGGARPIGAKITRAHRTMTETAI
jgi:hypothetical protein